MVTIIMVVMRIISFIAFGGMLATCGKNEKKLHEFFVLSMLICIMINSILSIVANHV